MSEKNQSELERRAALAPLCEQHGSGNGFRSGCLVCGLEEQSRALSRIDYLVGEPNDMGVSIYDTDPDEKDVVQRVVARLAELRGRIQKMHLACMPNNCILDGGPEHDEFWKAVNAQAGS